LIVGDAVGDIHAARRSGILFVGLREGCARAAEDRSYITRVPCAFIVTLMRSLKASTNWGSNRLENGFRRPRLTLTPKAIRSCSNSSPRDLPHSKPGFSPLT
jgi:hypothetical protein